MALLDKLNLNGCGETYRRYRKYFGCSGPAATTDPRAIIIVKERRMLYDGDYVSGCYVLS
jgi:hypothetical protein